MKKKLISLTLIICLCLALLPATVFAVDDYPYSGIAAGTYIVDEWNFYRGECTSFVSFRLNNNNGVAFTNYYGDVRWGNANNWDDAARRLGITVDNTPAVGAVAQTDSGGTGHVAWVSAVNGSSVTIEEYNYGWVIINGEYVGSHKYNTRTVDKSTFCYIHIKDIATNPSAPAQPSVSFSPWENSNYTYIGWTDAGIGQQIDVSNGTCSEVGMELYDQSGKLLATARDTNYYHRMFFKVNDECHYTLATGTTYKYKFYAIVNGKKYWGNEGSFKTGGPVPEAAKATIPGKPNVTVNSKDVTVSWKDVSNETSYEVYLIQTPWTWNDVKYSTTTAKDVTKYTFNNISPGDYKAFVVSKPNDRQSQSEWVPFTVTTTTVPGKPTVSVKDANVTVSWKDVPDETSYDVYLIQMPWGWEDVKYSTSTAKDVTKYTFKDVAPGDYKAFVVSKPNYKQWQSEWVPFTVAKASVPEVIAPETVEYTVSFNQSTLSLTAGDSANLPISYSPADASITWSSSNPSVATVSSGRVTAVEAGTSTITAKVGDKTASCTVKVEEKATLKIGTSSLTNATAGQYYSQKLVVNTTEGVSWTVASGSLPSGLTLASNGIISGTPMSDGTFSFTVQASSSVGTDSRAYTLAVDQAAAKRVDVHFSRQNVYHQDQFTDVKANQWFTDTVASAFELGLMKGNSAKTFNPYGDVTVAEAITMAARIHSINATGKESFVQSKTWWQTYLDYAYQNGIISSAYYNSDVTQKATRAQFAEIFASSLPEENLFAINQISDSSVPDVSMNANYASSVYRLYRAGILTGSDALGSFNPQTYITRAEAATILSRMAESNNRIEFTLGN